MQMCDECMKVYDESIYPRCPYCNPDGEARYPFEYDENGKLIIPEDMK